MPEDINSYVFDFKTEVDALRSAYPFLRERTSFFNIRVVREFLFGQVSFQNKIPGDLLEPEAVNSVQEQIRMIYAASPGASSMARSAPALNAGGIIALKNDDVYVQLYSNEDLAQLSTLYHEAAHILLPPAPEKDQVLRECEGDALFALYFLSRFGAEAQDIVSVKSWLRSAYMLNHDSEHFTSPVLDQILADSAREDFSKLTPDTLISRAASYAKNFAPRPSEIDEIRAEMRSADMAFDFLNPDAVVWNVRLRLLATTALSSANDMAFYGVAKFLQPFLHHSGVTIEYKEYKSTLWLDEKTSREIAAQIEERAGRTDFQRIFNRQTAVGTRTAFAQNAADVTDPLTRHLPVALPGNQTRANLLF